MLEDMHERCGQCRFAYARIDTECWGEQSARRVMCPICGWTKYEEQRWNFALATVTKRSVKRGYGAYRLIPPGGFSGYNAFHEPPSAAVIGHIRELLDNGWLGYLTLWDEERGRPRLLAGSPLQRYEFTDDGPAQD
ncbi:hypothetical protein GURASL_29870 [Geotalea uraniireducens]|uniref:Uncharacterized protein n=1 Tax=Geotalea uraniireducens TaxID=351604 RepID=A0ABN6VUP9_9BACT|nr:hypothetical protein [Geotalea uraniireducens]BDV44064.1 hypothetical protein GURASL_29870 [Geotalea uraniireducens]